MDGGGGPLSKTVSVPKPVDDSQYVNSLNMDQKEIYETYKLIQSTKNESKLIHLVESGSIGPNMVDKEGMTPLMQAVDCNFSPETIRRLIELGCDVNAQNSDGMTSLHLSMWQDNSELFETLLKNHADTKIEDNEGESVQESCQSRKLIDILEQTLAVSLTLSQANQKSKTE